MKKIDQDKEIKKIVLEQEKLGNVVVRGMDGLIGFNLDQFVQQPTDGILYDLNRLPEVVLTFINDPKWVNDYACQLVIKKLKARIDELESNDHQPQ